MLTVKRLTAVGGSEQPFQPKLHMTDADFRTITLNGVLCDKAVGLGAVEFEQVMREQASTPPRQNLSLMQLVLPLYFLLLHQGFRRGRTPNL